MKESSCWPRRPYQPEDAPVGSRQSPIHRMCVCVCVCVSNKTRLLHREACGVEDIGGEIDKKLLFFHTREARRCEERGEDAAETKRGGKRRNRGARE